MIKATFRKNKGSFIEYEVTGHAYFAEPGKDIVCAGVSTLYIAITNQLIFRSQAAVREKQVTILKQNEVNDALVDTLFCGLYDIQQSYPNCISVEVVDQSG